MSFTSDPDLGLRRPPGHPGARIRLSVRRGRIRALFAGEFDVSTVTLLTASLSALIREGPSPLCCCVVIDLGDVTFMDSSGLAALGSSCDLLTAAGWQLSLTRPASRLRVLLRQARADGWLAPSLRSQVVPAP